MTIERILINQNKPTKTVKQKIANSITQGKGATLQKLSQLFDATENRTLIEDKKKTEKVLELINLSSPSLYKNIISISDNYYQGSIGNVHSAYLRDGKRIAIKTLRSNIREQIQSDLINSSRLIDTASHFVDTNKFMNLEGFTSKFIQSLESECDFTNEMATYEKISGYFKDYEVLKIPKIYNEYSNKDILILEWVESDLNFDDLKSLSLDMRKKLQEELMDFFYSFPLIHGLLQEDSNISNFLITGSSVYVIDFGKFTFIPYSSRLALVKLIQTRKDNLPISLLGLYKQIGFNTELLIPIKSLLSSITDILLAPLLNKMTDYNFADWNPSKKIDSIAHDSKWNIRAAAPMHYFAITRSLAGFLKISGQLNCPISTTKVSDKILNYYEKEMIQFQATPDLDNQDTDKFLNIVVKRKDSEKVNLKLPYETIYEIDSLISSEIKNKLLARNLDIKSLVEKAVMNDSEYVFKLEEEDSSFEVRIIKA